MGFRVNLTFKSSSLRGGYKTFIAEERLASTFSVSQISVVETGKPFTSEPPSPKMDSIKERKSRRDILREAPRASLDMVTETR